MNKLKCIILLFVIYTWNSCAETQDTNKIRDFVSQHGDDDFSIFIGATLFYRGTNDNLLLISGITPEYKGGRDNIEATLIRYNVHDSAIATLERGHNEPIDTAYVHNLAKRFAELGIYEIRVDDDIVMIRIDENCHNLIARFENDSVMEKYDKEKMWKQISEMWYLVDK